MAWPAAGITLAALVSINPFFAPRLPLMAGVAAWLADFTLVMFLSLNHVSPRLGTLLSALFLAVPCFLNESPLLRALLMCTMALPFALSVGLLLAPETANPRERVAFFFTWFGKREVTRRPRRFAPESLIHLIAATLVCAALMAVLKALSLDNSWLIIRWLAGGLMIMAAAEMLTAAHAFMSSLMGVSAPSLMASPILSASLGEFWTRRWNPAASLLLFRMAVFSPLARSNTTLALCAAFFASAIAHILLPYMASGRWLLSVLCGAFFIVQPLLILAERRMKVRRWKPAAARAWTLCALAITSPLFVEPTLELLETSWGDNRELVLPMLAVLGFTLGVTLFFCVGALAVPSPRTLQQTEALQ